MANDYHSLQTDADGLHNPKGFDAASNSSALIKNASGILTWDTTEKLNTDNVGCSGYLSTGADTVFSGAGWEPAVGTFTFPVCEGFTYVGAAYDGIIYSHADTHWMAIDLSATVSSDTINTQVRMGYALNSNTVVTAGTWNSNLCRTAGEPYVIGTNFSIQVATSDELTLMMYADKAATITLETCQVNAFKLFQVN